VRYTLGMKLIVGLGNTGKEYVNTRHNAGFMAIDKLLSGQIAREDSKFEAEVFKSGDMLLCKPTTFMNESGRAVRKIVDFYKLSINDVVVLHDDLDIDFGEYKIQMGVGPKVHNGVTSVEEYLGGKDFLRVRIGINNREKNSFGGSGSDYVLSKFSSDESEELQDIIEEAVDELTDNFGLAS